MPKSVDSNLLEPIVEPVCSAHGVHLVDVRHLVERDGAVLRVLIELPQAETLPKGVSVTLDDCTRVSRALSQLLDARDDLLPGAYRLEVSSPGVERPLVKPHDFARYAGREIRVSTKLPTEGRRKFAGTLLGLRDDAVLLTDERGQEISIPYENIGKANLVFRF